MTAKDVPYVFLIIIFMVVTFFAGRYSVRVPSQPAQAPSAITVASAATTTPRPVADQGADTERVVPAQALPPVITIEALPATSQAKAASKPADPKPLTTPSSSTPVRPIAVELEDDPISVENPYKRKSATAR